MQTTKEDIQPFPLFSVKNPQTKIRKGGETEKARKVVNGRPLKPLMNARIFREIKSQDRKFPDRILQDGKFWDQKIPGIPNFHGIQEKKFEKIPGFFL